MKRLAQMLKRAPRWARFLALAYCVADLGGALAIAVTTARVARAATDPTTTAERPAGPTVVIVP